MAYDVGSSELFGDLKIKYFRKKDWAERDVEVLERVDQAFMRLESGLNKYGETVDPGLYGTGKAVILNALQEDIQLLNVACDDAMYGLPYVAYDFNGLTTDSVAFVCTSLGGTGDALPTVTVVAGVGALVVAVDASDNLTVTLAAGGSTMAAIALAMAASATVHAVWAVWTDVAPGTLTATEAQAATTATCNYGQGIEYTLSLALGSYTLRPITLLGSSADDGDGNFIYTADYADFYVLPYVALAGNPLYDWIALLQGVEGVGLLCGKLTARRSSIPFTAVYSTSADFGGGASGWINPVLDFHNFTILPASVLDARHINTTTVGVYVKDTVYQYDGDSWDAVTTPVAGTTVYNEFDDLYYRHSGTAWQVFSEAIGHNTLEDLQGGMASQYWHLTTAEHTAALAKLPMLTAAAAGVPASIVLAEDTANGVDTITMAAPATLTASRVVTVPDANVDLGAIAALGAENIDGEIATDFLRGIVESGIWAATIVGGLPALTRTAAAAAQTFWIPALIPTRSTALKGRMITGLVANYTVGGAILDDAIFELYKLTLAADLAVPTTAIEAVTYDGLHSAPADRGAIKNHRQIATVTAPDYLAVDEQLWIKLTVDGDAGVLGTFVLTGLKVLYSETLVDLV